MPGRHLPGGAAGLGEQRVEGMAEPGVELAGRGLCCRHFVLP
jgi:hypothetical protein